MNEGRDEEISKSVRTTNRRNMETGSALVYLCQHCPLPYGFELKVGDVVRSSQIPILRMNQTFIHVNELVTKATRATIHFRTWHSTSTSACTIVRQDAMVRIPKTISTHAEDISLNQRCHREAILEVCQGGAHHRTIRVYSLDVEGHSALSLLPLQCEFSHLARFISCRTSTHICMGVKTLMV